MHSCIAHALALCWNSAKWLDGDPEVLLAMLPFVDADLQVNYRRPQKDRPEHILQSTFSFTKRACSIRRAYLLFVRLGGAMLVW